MTGIPVFARDDIVFVPIEDLAPLALGLIWSTTRKNTKTRALAEVARALGPSPVQRTHQASVP